MTYSAVGLAVIGVLAGLAFRWKVLLPIIVVLPFAAIVLAVSRGFSHGEIVIAVFIGEAILQGGYFMGLLMRFIATAGKAPSPFKGGGNPERRRDDEHNAPPAGASKGS